MIVSLCLLKGPCDFLDLVTYLLQVQSFKWKNSHQPFQSKCNISICACVLKSDLILHDQIEEYWREPSTTVSCEEQVREESEPGSCFQHPQGRHPGGGGGAQTKIIEEQSLGTKVTGQEEEGRNAEQSRGSPAPQDLARKPDFGNGAKSGDYKNIFTVLAHVTIKHY